MACNFVFLLLLLSSPLFSFVANGQLTSSSSSSIRPRVVAAAAPASGNNNYAIYVRHSQTTGIPLCAHADDTLLWNGYSLLQTEHQGRATVQDIGLPGSCLRQFSAMPFVSCGANEVCQRGASVNTAASYWLASDMRQQYITWYGLDDSREQPLRNDEANLEQISRCSVCLSNTGPKVAIHSQSSLIPNCPSSQWQSLWTGYSFLMHAVGVIGGGQSLASPGSCLPDYRHHVYIKCAADGVNSNGSCAYDSQMMAYWLAINDNATPFFVRKREEASSSIARCRVCSL